MNNATSEIVIASSKRKTLILLLGSAAFTAIGIWFVLDPPETGNIVFSPVRLKVAGILAIAFFGVGGLLILRRLFDPKPAVIINDNGFVDNASAAAAGMVLWSDVEGIDLVTVQGQSFLTVIVRNPVEYTERQHGKWRKMLMNANYRAYGTPITIPASVLTVPIQELKTTLETRLASARQAATVSR